MTQLPVLLVHNIDPDWPPNDREIASAEADRLTGELRAMGHHVISIAVGDADLAACLKQYDPNRWVVFNWCEELPGIPQSDALAANIIEQNGFTYTGPPPAVLRLSWDKGYMKRLLDELRIPTPIWRMCHTADAGDWRLFPAIVKPSQEHCSFGITVGAVVENTFELEARIGYVLSTFKQPALVEDFIDGREFRVSLWGNEEVQMLPVAEYDFSRFADARERLCSYEAKYQPGSRHYEEIQLLLPAPLTEAEITLLYKTALAAYRAFGCRDFARLDVRMRDGVFYVLDINPNPDISSDASMACAAQAAGYSFGAMCSRLAGLAAARHPVFKNI